MNAWADLESILKGLIRAVIDQSLYIFLLPFGYLSSSSFASFSFLFPLKSLVFLIFGCYI